MQHVFPDGSYVTSDGEGVQRSVYFVKKNCEGVRKRIVTKREYCVWKEGIDFFHFGKDDTTCLIHRSERGWCRQAFQRPVLRLIVVIWRRADGLSPL